MAAIVKETVTTDNNSVTRAISEKEDSVNTSIRLTYFLFGILEALLVLRFVFRITGANPASVFVSFIYSITQVFVWPFEGIFRRATAPGVETRSVFEPSVLIALIVYAAIAWGIAQLILIMSRKPDPEAL